MNDTNAPDTTMLPPGYRLEPVWPGAVDHYVVLDAAGRTVGRIIPTGQPYGSAWRLQCFPDEDFATPLTARDARFPLPEAAAGALVATLEPAELTPALMQRYVAGIDGDPIAEHVDEDVCCRILLRAIRDGRCTDPAACAEVLLAVLDDYERSRYFA